MYKNYKYVNAGTNEIHRYGKKAQERAAIALEPNEKGFYSIPADGGKYWTFGTSNGKFGEYAKINNTFFSVNSAGFIYAKVGTQKGEAFVQAIKNFIKAMEEINEARTNEA